MDRRILIACVGNIFLGDDAFGVEVAKRLTQLPLAPGVRVVDFGIRSYDLAYSLMEEWDLVILVDAVPRGGQPGTIYIIDAELPHAASHPPTIDAHSMNPVSVLSLVSALGGQLKRMIVVGCEPSPVDPTEPGMGLSAPVLAAIGESVEVIQKLVADFPAVIAVGPERK